MTMSIDYDKQISSVVKEMPPSAIRRFFDLANEMKGNVISLSISEPDFVTPWRVREAGIFSLEDGNTHYSPNRGYMEVREAISSYMNRRLHLQYDAKDQILVTVGGSEGLDLVARALINPGDEVIIIEPCFVAYRATVTFSHGVPVVIETKEKDDFKLLPEDLENAITDKTKYIILAYPGNPTGATMNREELARIRDVLLKHPDIVVVSDELYTELTYTEEGPCSIASFPELYDRTIIINGFSKSFAMTGWRIGFVCGPAALVSQMTKIHQYCLMCAPTTAQYAIIEAALNGDKDVDEMKKEYNMRRRVIVNGLREAGLHCFEPTGAFYAFPNITSVGLSSNEFCERFLMEKRVAIVPGAAFGQCGEGYVRISYAASMENIVEAMRRLKDFIGEVKEGKNTNA